MAAGDITFYDLWLQSLVDEVGSGLTAGSLPVEFPTDTIKVAYMTDSFVADTDETTVQKHWDDVSADQVALATAYTGPITLTSPSVSVTGGVVTVDFADTSVALDAAGFTNGRWLVFFKDTGTPSTSPLLAIGDLGALKSIVDGSQDNEWAGTGLFTIGSA